MNFLFTDLDTNETFNVETDSPLQAYIKSMFDEPDRPCHIEIQNGEMILDGCVRVTAADPADAEAATMIFVNDLSTFVTGE